MQPRREKFSINIRIDHRESSSGLIDLLRKDGVTAEVKRIHYGDYIINDSVTIERKTAEDLLISIIDGRLFAQISNMKNNCVRPVLLVEGDRFNTHIDIDPKAIKGALISVSVIWHVPILFSTSKMETKDIMLMMRASVEELAEVDGVGRTLAARMREVLDQELRPGSRSSSGRN